MRLREKIKKKRSKEEIPTSIVKKKKKKNLDKQKAEEVLRNTKLHNDKRKINVI